MKNKLFIALEGIDGSGKSTQARLLTEKLVNEGHKVFSTFEPTDGFIGSLIRDIMKKKIEADNRTIAALFAADRLDHLLNKTNGIIKKINDGYTVITDRYYLSSYAYNGAHMPMEWVIEANSLSAGILKPDLHIYIDILPDNSMKRLSGSRGSMELYETLENLQNVRNKYFEAIQLLKFKENIFITDGNRSPDLITADIWNEINGIYAGTKTN